MTKVKISRNNLLGTLPQKSMINSSKASLIGKTFVIGSMVEDENVKNTNLEEDGNKDAGRVRYRFTEEGGHATVILSVRQLLFMDVVKDNTVVTEAGFDTATTETIVLHELLSENMKTTPDASIGLPDKLTVVDVQTLQKEGTDGVKHNAYPAYMYDKFAKESKGKTGDALGKLYLDFDLMSSLPGSNRLPRFDKKTTEPIKKLVVNSYIDAV